MVSVPSAFHHPRPPFLSSHPIKTEVRPIPILRVVRIRSFDATCDTWGRGAIDEGKGNSTGSPQEDRSRSTLPPFGEEGRRPWDTPQDGSVHPTARDTRRGEGRSSARRERVGPRFPVLGRGTGWVDAGRAVEDPFRGGGGGGGGIHLLQGLPSRAWFPPPSTLLLDPEMNRGYPPDHRPFFVSFSQGHEKGGGIRSRPIRPAFGEPGPGDPNPTGSMKSTSGGFLGSAPVPTPTSSWRTADLDQEDRQTDTNA